MESIFLLNISRSNTLHKKLLTHFLFEGEFADSGVLVINKHQSAEYTVMIIFDYIFYQNGFGEIIRWKEG